MCVYLVLLINCYENPITLLRNKITPVLNVQSIMNEIESFACKLVWVQSKQMDGRDPDLVKGLLSTVQNVFENLFDIDCHWFRSLNE